MEMGKEFRLILGAAFFAAIHFVTGCANSKGRTLIVMPDTKPQTETAFHGLTARPDSTSGKRDRILLDIHSNDWVGNRDGVSTGWRSIGFNWNFLFDQPLNRKSTLAIASGLRFGKTVVHHQGLFYYDFTSNNTYLDNPIGLSFNRTRQRFIQSFLDVPLELRLRGEGKKSFRLTIGGSAGLRLNSYERWRVGSEKFRYYNHPNLMVWRAGAHTRIGYGRWNFYGAYYFTPMFNKSNSDNLNVWQAGISFSFF